MERILRVLDQLVGVSEATVSGLVHTLFGLKDRSGLLSEIMQVNLFDS